MRVVSSQSYQSFYWEESASGTALHTEISALLTGPAQGHASSHEHLQCAGCLCLHRPHVYSLVAPTALVPLLSPNPVPLHGPDMPPLAYSSTFLLEPSSTLTLAGPPPHHECGSPSFLLPGSSILFTFMALCGLSHPLQLSLLSWSSEGHSIWAVQENCLLKKILWLKGRR